MRTLRGLLLVSRTDGDPPPLSLLSPSPPCVRPKNASVCRFKTSPCVPAPRPHVVTHAGVVPVHTEAFLNVHTGTPHHTTPQHTQHITPQHTPHRDRDRQKQRETERDRERETRQDKRREETREEEEKIRDERRDQRRRRDERRDQMKKKRQDRR